MKNILNNKIYISDIKRVIERFDLHCLNGRSILVTGGLGLICSSVVDLLVMYNECHNADVKIYIAARNKQLFEERYGVYPYIKYINYDATKPINFDFRVDYIIHGAGVASPELYVAKPVETMLSNFNGVLNLVWCSDIVIGFGLCVQKSLPRFLRFTVFSAASFIDGFIQISRSMQLCCRCLKFRSGQNAGSQNHDGGTKHGETTFQAAFQL